MSKSEALTSIRQAEAEVSRRIVAAQEEAEHIRAQAQAEAAVILDAARAKAECDSLALRQDLLTQGQDEAQAILDEAKQQSDELITQGRARVAEAVARAMRFVMGDAEV